MVEVETIVCWYLPLGNPTIRGFLNGGANSGFRPSTAFLRVLGVVVTGSPGQDLRAHGTKTRASMRIEKERTGWNAPRTGSCHLLIVSASTLSAWGCCDAGYLQKLPFAIVFVPLLVS